MTIDVECSLSAYLSCVDSNMRDEMKRRLSVCFSCVPIWGVEWNVVSPSVLLLKIPIWGGDETKFSRLSVLRRFKLEGEIKRSLSVCLSYVDPNTRGEMKCSLCVCFTLILLWGFKWYVVCLPMVCRLFLKKNRQYEEYVCLSYLHPNMKCSIFGIKWNVVCPPVFRRLQ